MKPNRDLARSKPYPTDPMDALMEQYRSLQFEAFKVEQFKRIRLHKKRISEEGIRSLLEKITTT